MAILSRVRGQSARACQRRYADFAENRTALGTVPEREREKAGLDSATGSQTGLSATRIAWRKKRKGGKWCSSRDLRPVTESRSEVKFLIAERTGRFGAGCGRDWRSMSASSLSRLQTAHSRRCQLSHRYRAIGAERFKRTRSQLYVKVDSRRERRLWGLIRNNL